MSGISDRIAAILREELAPFMTGFCSGAEIDMDEDYLVDIVVTDLAADLAEDIEQHLGLHEEWGVIAPTGHARTASTAEGARWLRDRCGYTARHRFVTGWTEEGKEAVAQHQN